MRRARLGVLLTASLALTAAAAFVLSACAGPALRVNLPDSAREVPLDTSLEVIASGALLQRVTLERIDRPTGPVELARTEQGARLTNRLEPDAEYWLLASALPSRATALPWQEPPPAPLSIQRVFTTARSPLLVEEEEPPLLLRGQPVELRFSQPIERALLESATHEIEARIAAADPHVILVDVAEPAAGWPLELRLSEVVARNGVAGPDRTLVIDTPEPVRVLAVGGAAPSERVTVPHDLPVKLRWNRPVTSVQYRIDSEPGAWAGSIPRFELELPLRLPQGQTAILAVDDVEAADGGWLAAPQRFEILSAPALQVQAFWPAEGAVNVSPRADPTFRFSEPVADRAAAEAAISFDPPVPGRFEWLAPSRVRFLPDDSFPQETGIAMRVENGPRGPRGQSGAHLLEPFASTFQVGKLKVIEVSLSRQTLTLLEDDVVVFTAPVATGVRGADTPPGTYEVLYKMPRARFRGVNPDGSRYDIPDVNWVLAFYGDYTIHGAYWRSVFGRPGSNGCISMTDASARYVFNWAEVGTQVIVRA